MTTNSFDATGSTAIVTGANSGIGRSTAEHLLEAGARVVATDIADGEGLGDLSAAGAEIVVADLSDPESRTRLVATAGETDFLVNSAGIIRLRPLDMVTEDDWDAIMAVNAKATFFLIQCVSPHTRDGGSIVNLSSMGARRNVNVETAVYGASKAAVTSMTRSWAYGLAHRGIRVNSVLPGQIDTPMQAKAIRGIAEGSQLTAEELANRRLAEIPLGRMGTADDVADTIMWLLSPGSKYLTGQSFAVDGGVTMY
jgi:NAD(P)-dependent dehydrogenase (short-subunit alcohol dehydrogenase family)